MCRRLSLRPPEITPLSYGPASFRHNPPSWSYLARLILYDLRRRKSGTTGCLPGIERSDGGSFLEYSIGNCETTRVWTCADLLRQPWIMNYVISHFLSDSRFRCRVTCNRPLPYFRAFSLCDCCINIYPSPQPVTDKRLTRAI